MLQLEGGKPASTAGMEVQMVLDALRAVVKLRLDDEILIDDEIESTTLRHMAIGVGAGLVPWNFPMYLGNVKTAQALLTGNTVIMKPSPFTPYCNLKVGELGIDIFPPGVFQVISGADDLGQMLTEHPGIDKISFTGSTFTGTKVMQSCSKTLKRVTLELGGNDATVVCEDADLEKAVPTIGTMAFLNAGQICMAIKRVYVHHSIYDEFKNRLVEFVRNNMKLGDPSDPNTSIGPVQNKLQYDKVKTLYEDIETSGWKPLLGAKVPKLDGENKGYFISPEIIDNPADDSRIVVEEPFGPILPLLKWSKDDEVLDRVNDTLQGLGGSVWSRDLERATRIAQAIQSGTVWVNGHGMIEAGVPFGGMKASGMGREFGLDGLKAWVELQALWVMK